MKLTRIFLLIAVLASFIGQVNAQILTPEQKKTLYRDSFLDYDDTFDLDSIRNFQQRKVVKHPPIREADVMWSKRVWREIEVSEKLNHVLYYPIKEIEDRKSLYQVIQDAYRDGLIQAFDQFKAGTAEPDDEFTVPVSIGYCDSSLFGGSRIEEVRDLNDEIIPDSFKTVVDEYTARDVVRYRLKEDWYFDKQHSQMRVKILGIMPIVRYTDQTGAFQEKGTAWFYFPEVRHVLVNYEVFNRGNKTQRMTFDDIFTKRKFSSHIIKEENVYTREVKDYKTNKYDAYLEGERIKEEMILFEHDLWSY